MLEDKISDTTEQPEVEYKIMKKVVRQKEYNTDQEGIRANSEKEFSKKRRMIEFRRELWKDGCGAQLSSMKLTGATVKVDDFVKYLIDELEIAPPEKNVDVEDNEKKLFLLFLFVTFVKITFHG